MSGNAAAGVIIEVIIINRLYGNAGMYLKFLFDPYNIFMLI